MKASDFSYSIQARNGLRKQYRIAPWSLLALLLLLPFIMRAQDNPALPERPNPPRLVNDLAGALQPDERAQLERKLDAYNDSTSTQITIVIVKTTDPYPIGDYAFQIGRKWGVGQKGKNNGLVLCWATETRKVFIATGYGLEGAIPDAIAKRIVNETIIPAFKQQQFFAGLDAATTEIIQRAQGEYQTDTSAEDDGGAGFIILLIIGFIILAIIFRNRGGGSNRSRGGGFGPVFFPTTYSGWGSSSGGGFGGGSSGGGGFGGFGGGSFGGGGAGGSY